MKIKNVVISFLIGLALTSLALFIITALLFHFTGVHMTAAQIDDAAVQYGMTYLMVIGTFIGVYYTLKFTAHSMQVEQITSARPYIVLSKLPELPELEDTCYTIELDPNNDDPEKASKTDIDGPGKYALSFRFTNCGSSAAVNFVMDVLGSDSEKKYFGTNSSFILKDQSEDLILTGNVDCLNENLRLSCAYSDIFDNAYEQIYKIKLDQDGDEIGVTKIIEEQKILKPDKKVGKVKYERSKKDDTI